MRLPGPRTVPATTLGVYAPLLAVLLAAWIVFLVVPATGAFPWKWDSLSQSYAAVSAVGVLTVVYTVWFVLVVRQWITPATGAGFAVAAHGVICHALATLLEAFLLPGWGREIVPHDPVYGVLDLAYDLGFAAFVTGIAFVVASSVGERLIRRRAPDWALPH